MRLLTVLSVVSTLAVLAPPAAAEGGRERDEAQPMSFSATVGAETPDEAIQALAFLPNDLTVNVGDTVNWSFPTHEPHAVSFSCRANRVRPLVQHPRPTILCLTATSFLNSGILVDGQTFRVTFGESGDFPFVCLIHGKMSGTLHVQPTGTPRDDDTNTFAELGRRAGRICSEKASTCKGRSFRRSDATWMT